MLIFISIGFLVGWFAGNRLSASCQNKIQALRLDNRYSYINPLLACDTEFELESGSTESLKQKIAELITEEKEKGNVSAASVFIRDYDGGYTVNVNPDEKFYPASLGKIPLMISVLKTVEKNPNFLNETYLYNDATGYNVKNEVPPTSFLETGKTYSVNEAMLKMIQNSDNNALIFLSKLIDPAIFKATFNELKVPVNENTRSTEDFMTAKEFSYFLRILYNATYLNRDSSEKALEILGNTDFKEGLVAGLPQDIKVVHKFGLLSYYDKEVVTERELHDCGIVYPSSSKPYLVCVMTKGNNPVLNNQENVIKSISTIVYDGLKK